MGLYAIFEATKQRMPDDYPVEFFYKTGEEDKYGKPRRIVVEYGSEGFGGPRGAGASGYPGTLWTRRSLVTVELWGNDLDDAEVLLGHFVAALHDAAHGSYELAGGQWLAGGVSAKGVAYALRVELQIPITREPDTYATITSAPLTAEFNIPTTTPITEP